jgi:benzoylformate decarboxylase
MLATEPYLFALDATVLPRPYVKWAVEPARAADVPGAIARAAYTALQRPCGPAFVSIPEDDWDAGSEPVVHRHVHGEFAGDVAALDAVAAALATAHDPALVVGAAVDRDGAWSDVVELASRLPAAVWAAPLSSRASFPEDHPAFAGFLLPQREKLASQLAAHDVVVVLGAPVFTYHVPGGGCVVADGTALFQLVDDPVAAAYAPVGEAILTSIRPAVRHLLDRLPEPASEPRAPRRSRPSAPPATQPLSGAFVMHTVRRLMPSDAIVVEEAPTHRNAMHDHLPITRSDGLFVGASGGLGYALPAAVGVALGRPGERVVCLLGDGSSLYSIQALWTAAQHALPVTFVVLNNAGYVALTALGAVMGIAHPPGVDLPGLDLAGIATGFGCPACRVEEAGELEDALTASFTAPGPALIDVAVESNPSPLY